MTQVFFILGLFALLFVMLASSSEELAARMTMFGLLRPQVPAAVPAPLGAVKDLQNHGFAMPS